MQNLKYTGIFNEIQGLIQFHIYINYLNGQGTTKSSKHQQFLND